jgi:hypothetical protein
MSWFRESWPPFSSTWDLPFGTLTDLFGIGLSIIILLFTAFVAIRQLKIMRDQTVMIKEQGVLSKRQTELAETQDAIIQQQLRRRSDLRVRTPNSSRLSDGTLRCRVVVMNGGDKTAEGCHWELFVKREESNWFGFTNENFTKLTPRFAAFSETEQYDKVEGFIKARIYPGTSMDLCSIAIRDTAPEEFAVYWRIKCDEGLVPPKGLAQIDFRRESAGLVENRYPDHWTVDNLPVGRK